MELKKVFKERRSVRKFKDIDVSDEIIKEILEAANTAPCTDTCNYHFGVIKNKEVKKQIGAATIYADWVENAPVIFVCCSNIDFDIKNDKPESYAHKGMTARYGNELVDFLLNANDRKSVKTLMQAAPAYIAAQHMGLLNNSPKLTQKMV